VDVVSFGGPLAIVLASAVGWLVAGVALRPVERIRQQASAITASGMDRRLSVPLAKDELRRLIETLNDMLTRLDEAMKREQRLLDSASHELRTPLTALKAELELATSRPRSVDELRAALRSASEEADRLAALAEDLLVLARVRHGQLPLHRQQTTLLGLVDSSQRLFRARAAAKNVQVEAAAPNVTVSVDAMRVRQAIDNLLDNAIRWSPPRGTVRIEATVQGSIVRITVTDNGPGFAYPVRDDAAPASAFGSTGFGLAIVQAIAESHGGELRAHTLAGGGAHVTMTMISADGVAP
jgi:signal transduction histidine kinase